MNKAAYKSKAKLLLLRKNVLYMKTSVFCLMISLQISATNHAQDKISLHLSNTPIFQVLKSIEKNSQYRLNYSQDVIPVNSLVTVNVKNATINEVLYELFKGYPVTWKMAGDFNIIISSSEKGAGVIHDGFWKMISGTIRNESGQPMQGVSVVVKGGTSGTSTDASGRYSIEVENNSVLIFSYVGYTTQEVANLQAELNITMQLAAGSGEEVLVIGYGKQKKLSMTSAVASVKGESLQFPGRNLSANLQGQLPGIISFQRSGEPGYDNATFWIRGISTFNGVQNPLILVDGIPRSFNDIDPNEIETFNILKDASATAVFGAEGANGVILVTTKRGKVQKTQITYRGEYSHLTPLRMPEFLGAVDHMTLYNEALGNEATPQPPLFSQELIDKYRSGIDPDLYPDINWVDEILKENTNNTRHNISFRGGTGVTRYFVAGTFYNESGLFQNNSVNNYSSNINLKRYNLRSNIDIDVSKTTLLRVDMSAQYLETHYPRVNTGRLLSTVFIAPPYLYPTIYSDGKLAQHPRPSGNRVNPYNLLNHSGYTNEYRSGIQTRVDIEQKLNFITQGLMLKLSTSYDYDGYYAIYASKSIKAFAATGRGLDGKIVYNQLATGTGDVVADGQRLTSEKRLYSEASLNYNRSFGKHEVSAMALAYAKETQPVDELLSGIQRLPYRKMAYVGRTAYTFDRRYAIEASIGITGSENFTEKYRWGYFPAIGVSWNVTNENFFPEALKSVISGMKLRASIGLTGNDQIGRPGSNRFLYRGGFVGATGTSLGYTVGGPQNSLGGLVEERFSFPNISWEKELKRNFGIDLLLFNNSLSITADYFSNRRKDILLQRQTASGTAGFRQAPYQNYGIVTNKGVDAGLTYRKKLGQFSAISVRGNFTFARNKIVEFDEIAQLHPWMASTGNRLNMNDVFVADRLFEDGDFDISGNSYTLKPGIANQNYLNTNIRPGDIKYVDLNNDGFINQFDRTKYIGNPTAPEIVYGFGAGYEYKGFSLNAFFTGVANTTVVLGAGNDAYSPLYSSDGNAQGFFPFAWGVDETSLRTIALDRWTSAKPSQDVLFPRLRTTGFANNTVPSTWWMRNGSFLRLKTAELGYKLPQTVIRKLGISNAKVYLIGYNLLTRDHIKFWDPEQGNANAGMTYPQTRSFTIGAEISL